MAPKSKNLIFDGKQVKVNGQSFCTSSRFDCPTDPPSTRPSPACSPFSRFADPSRCTNRLYRPCLCVCTLVPPRRRALPRRPHPRAPPTLDRVNFDFGSFGPSGSCSLLPAPSRHLQQVRPAPFDLPLLPHSLILLLRCAQVHRRLSARGGYDALGRDPELLRARTVYRQAQGAHQGHERLQGDGRCVLLVAGASGARAAFSQPTHVDASLAV